MKTIREMAVEAGFEIDLDEICIPSASDGYTGVEAELLRFAELVRADERNSWPAEMEAMERQVNILTDALAQARSNT